jgi:photosystem II stability/assembly factor-like uncharacterized protein
MSDQDMMMSENIAQDIVYALAASAGGPCFAARHSGLWRSEDQGLTWQQIEVLPDEPDQLTVTAVAVSPDFQNDGNIFAGVPGGILRSSDGGAQFSFAALAVPPPSISALALSPSYAQDGIVFAATLEDGMFRSHDRGRSWQAWHFGLFDMNVLCIAISPAFSQDRTVYVGTETGIFCSRNGGRAWQEIGFENELAPVLSLAVSPQFAEDGILFAGTEAAGLFRSDNMGDSWQLVLESEVVNYVLAAPDLLAATDDRLWRSGDSGQTWTSQTPTGLGDAVITAAALSGPTLDSPLLIGLSDGQILRV